MKRILKVNFQRLLWLVVLFALCVVTVMGGFSAAPVAYADTVIGDVQMDSSNVMDDLENSTIDGVPFDIANYAFDESKQAQVFMFAEYCYSFYSNMQGNYALYVYVWNPQGLKFKTNSTLNTISLRAGEDNSGEYNKYLLLYLNQCEIANYEGLFLKFKVFLSAEQKEQIFDGLPSNKRVYSVGEIELITDGSSSAQSYYVGTKYTFEGYAKGYGADVNAESTLLCKNEQNETLSLNVESTYYYPDGTHSDGITRDVLQSVYFSVPNDIIAAYGAMSAVHATWLNAYTAPMLVTGNRSIYDTILPYLGQYVNGGTREEYNVSPFEYAIIATKAAEGLRDDDETAPYAGYYAYNTYAGHHAGETNLVGSYDNFIRTLYYLFYANGNASDYVITSETLFDWLETYTAQYGGNLVNDRYSSVLFDKVDSAFEDVTITADDEYKLTDNIVDDSGWNRIFGTTVKSENYISVSAIQPVTSGDIAACTSKAEFCDKFYIAESDYDDFCAYVNEAESKNETVYLFRYKQSEYISVQATEYERVTEDILFQGTFGCWDYIDLNAYFAQMWVQLDFDIIDVTFSNGESSTTIGVAMSPMDIAPDGLPPASWQEEAPPAWWAYVIIVLAEILGLLLLSLLLCKICNLPCWIMIVLVLLVVVLDIFFIQSWALSLTRLLQPYLGWLPFS